MGDWSTEKCQAQQYVRKYLLESIRRAQNEQSPDSLIEAYREYCKQVAAVIYGVKFGTRPLTLSEAADDIADIVYKTKVRAITITWEGGENNLYPLIEIYGKVFEGAVIDGVLLPIKQ